MDKLVGFLRGNRILLLACLVIVAGAGLRIWHLDSESLWTDELFTVAGALDVGADKHWLDFTPKTIRKLTFDDSFATWKAADNTPPLFDILLIAWAKCFGSSDFALRLLPALIGCLAPLAFFFGLRRPIGSQAALLGATMLAFSPQAIIYSQEVRAYVLTLLLSTIVLVRILRHCIDNRPPYERGVFDHLWWDIFLMVLLAYSHYTGLIIAGALAAIYVLYVALPRKQYSDVAKFLVVPLAMLPWIAISWKALKSSSEGGMAWFKTPPSINDYMMPKALDFFLPHGGTLLVALLLLSLVVALAEPAHSERADGLSSGLLAKLGNIKIQLGLLCFCVVVVLFLYSLYTAYTARMWHVRYLVGAIPIVMASFALFFSALGKRAFYNVAVTLVVTVISISFLLKYDAGRPWKSQYREGAQFIAQNIQDNALILLGWKGNEALYRHYLDKLLVTTNKSYQYLPVSHVSEIEQLCQQKVFLGRQVFIFKHHSHPRYGKAINDCPHSRKVKVKNVRHLVVGEFEFPPQQ